MSKFFPFLLSALLFSACTDDETPQPAYQLALADLTTNASGQATQLGLDDGSQPSLAQPISGLKSDTTYRIQALYTLNGNQATLKDYAQILSFQPLKAKPSHAKTDALSVVACWKGKNYINLQFSLKGSATGVHYLGAYVKDTLVHANGTTTQQIQLMHDQNNDPLYFNRSSYLSVSLGEKTTTTCDSIRIFINTFDGEKSYTFAR